MSACNGCWLLLVQEKNKKKEEKYAPSFAWRFFFSSSDKQGETSDRRIFYHVPSLHQHDDVAFARPKINAKRNAKDEENSLFLSMMLNVFDATWLAS